MKPSLHMHTKHSNCQSLCVYFCFGGLCLREAEQPGVDSLDESESN